MAFYEVVKTFRVKQDGNSIELREGQIVSIPSGQEMQLLSTGRIKPCAEDESIRSSPVPGPDDERFQDTFNRATGEMAAGYKSGFFDRARRQCPERYARFGRAEDRISKYWDEGNYEGFEKELGEWQDIYKSILALFGSGNHG